MRVLTTWYAAPVEAAPTLLAAEGDREPAWLEGVGELELAALGELLGARYDPWLVHPDAPTVLRINREFLAAVAAIDELAEAAAAWRRAAEGLAGVELRELESTLAAMRACARAGLGGPGVLSVPAV
jgi:hypothetical protein